MDNQIVQEKGYTVIYNDSDGKIGFIGIDDHSGGYPFFATWPDTRHIYDTISAALDLLESGKKMNQCYGAAKVHFDTMRIVKMSTVFQEVAVDLDAILYKEAIGKLTDAELDIIERYVKENKS